LIGFPAMGPVPSLQASGAWLLGLAGLAGLLAPARGQSLDSLEDFGRWQSRPSHCRLQQSSSSAGSSPATRDCRSVRIDQQLPGLLSLRFSEASANGPLGSPQLMLAGVLQPGSRALDCRDGRCQPHWPLTLQVSALADRGLRTRADLSQLPQARLAQGICHLNAQGVRCQAEDSDGLLWQVEADW
jgi:hypothetical protein